MCIPLTGCIPLSGCRVQACEWCGHVAQQELLLFRGAYRGGCGNVRRSARRAHGRALVPPRTQGPAKPGELGVGPLRIWPGGLCVSRSIGDLDAGPEVVPVPHIKQVGQAPGGGVRSGLGWDVQHSGT